MTADPTTLALSAIGGVASLARELLKSKGDEKSQGTIVEMMSLLMEAQTNTMAVKVENAALLQDKRDLEAEIQRLLDWTSEKQRYALMQIWAGASAYALKASQSNGEAPHLLCPNCFSQSKKSFLSPYQGAANNHGRTNGIACGVCPTKISYQHGSVPAANYAPG